MHVYTLGAAVRFPAPHGCYYSVFRLYTAVDDRFRQHNARIFKKNLHRSSLFQQVFSRIRIKIYTSMVMTAKNSRRAVCVDLAAEHARSCFCLRCTRRGANQVPSLHDRGDRDCQRICWYFVDGSKAAVVYLLHPADLLQLYALDNCFVTKISDGWIVEGDMSVFSDAQQHDVKRVRGEQMRVSFGFAVNIRRVSINKINRFEGKSVENSVFQVCSESGRMCFSKPDVLVHVKRIHA